ncbi:hypothetical protein BJ546DRAFT_113837 [Cryomyces antarcticus]
MACHLYRPVECLYRSSSPWTSGIRHFSQNPLHHAASRGAAPEMRQQKLASVQTQMKEMQAKGKGQAGRLPNDIGLLPLTFITPTGHNRPSLFSDPKGLWKMESTRLKTRVRDFVSVLGFKFFMNGRFKRPWMNLELRRLPSIATAMQRQMYTAFADGDIETLRRICADGLLASFRARLENRPVSQRFRWTFHNHTSRPRVISHKAVILPASLGGGKAAVRQVVVRIKSRQSLVRIQKVRQKDGSMVEKLAGPEEPKEVTENVLIQKQLWNGKEGPWIVWGTVEETTSERWQTELEKAQALGL